MNTSDSGVMKSVALLALLFFRMGSLAAEEFPKLVIAHHMNAEPPTKAGGQDTFGRNTPTPPLIQPGSPWAQVGGRVRDRAIGNLYGVAAWPVDKQIAWEIGIARRAGVDAFAFYGSLPSGESRVLEYMRAAKGTGLKITLCSGGGERGGNAEAAIASLRRLIEADQELDVLLRVRGKLLMLTYGGNWGDNRTVESMVAKRREIEARVGTPMLILYHPTVTQVSSAERSRLGALLDGGFDGLCPFMVNASEEAAAISRFWGDVCRAHGKPYFAPINFQFHSPLHMTHAPVADTNWRRSWDVAHEKASGVQLVTWNDWGETTALAPGVNSNYGLYDLLREEVAGFKSEASPEVTVDRAWVLYYRYPSDAEPALCYPPSPRSFRGPEHDFIWVLTSLTTPARVVCEGRGEREAPAGRSMVSFPLTPGPVRIEIQRDNETVVTLQPPEVVTKRPWRPDHSLVAFCDDTRERDYHAQDFHGLGPRFLGEYADDDGDGLFNWFEGLFFSELEQPATVIGPADQFNGVPCSRAQAEFRDPVMLPAHYPAGFRWTTRGLPKLSGTPAPDVNGVPVWEFCFPLQDNQKPLPPLRSHQESGAWSWMLVRGHAMQRLSTDGRLYLQPGSVSEEPVDAALVWISPVNGKIRVKAVFQQEHSGGGSLRVRMQGDDTRKETQWSETVSIGKAASCERVIEVSAGDRLRFVCQNDPPRRAPHGVFLDLVIELVESSTPPARGDQCDPPHILNLAQYESEFATAIWRGRYRWGEAGLRHTPAGLAVINIGDPNAREMLAFHDPVPNATYGPLCRWGDTEVRASITFEQGDAPPTSWGGPAFAVTTRISPGRRSMYFLGIDVPQQQNSATPSTARLRLGRMKRAAFESPETDVFAEAMVPLPQDASFTLALSSCGGRGTAILLKGTCILSDGTECAVLTRERQLPDDGAARLGEVGFAASAGTRSGRSNDPGRIRIRSFTIGPYRHHE